jgi:site-specific DNA-cytosine methylase
MRHLGDVSKINGAEIEPIDIITFGSPCQDLSVAGKRAGLKHEANGDEETTRSGLFMEAVRIIKEMRRATNGVYPSFAIWENVPGAFSSNGGEDFRVVLEELIKICEPGATVPSPEKGKWPYSDAYVGDGWSLAYRTLDAQYWGVPQRRRRIYLVLDLRGERAHKVLFEREGLRGYFEKGRAPWQGTAADAENRPGTADRKGTGDCVGFQRQLSGVEAQNEKAPTILAAAGESGNNKPCVAYTLKIRSGCEGGGKGALIQEGKSATLATNNDQYLFQPMAYSFDSLASNSMKSSNPHSGCRAVEVAKTLDTTDPNPCKNQGGIAVLQPVTVEPGIAAREGGHIYDGVCGTLRADAGDNRMAVAYGVTTKGNGDAFISEERHTAISAGGGQPGQGYPCAMVAFAQNQRDEVRLLGDKAGSLQAQPGMKQQTFIIDSIGGQAERGWEGEVAPTLKATHYKCAPCVTVPAAGFCTEHSANARGIGYQEECAPTLRAGVTPALVYSIENHPADSRVDIDDSGKVQTLTSRMGTGGGNVPMVMEQHLFESHPMDSRVKECDSVAPTVTTKYAKGGVDTPLVCEKEPVYCLQGNGIDRADTAGCNGAGWREGASYTLNTIDRPAVAYATDIGFFNSIENTSPTLLARSYKDPHLVTYPEDKIHYIVRRLTPTECARLQGFPDTWGHINPKEDLTDDEFKFWHEVRNTHAAINGKTVKQYTKPQMLTWYNKLWTDSAEYKMWGNGIALPTALYVMQGIADALKAERNADEPQPTTANETKESETRVYNERTEEMKVTTMEKLSTIQKRENLNAIYRTGEPGPGGAYHDYDIYPRGCNPNTTEVAMACIEFQKGPRNSPESRHGILDTDLLEIVRDRLKAFQSGLYATRENAIALTHIEEALMWMNRRVEDRIERNVLGTMEK